MREENHSRSKTRSSAGKTHSAARDVAWIALGVALITVCAWITLPFGEVPFTLQTFAVAAVGGLLGIKRGSAAVAVYVLMGLIGIPVFAGFKAGVAALMGPTGGYILGFLFAALLPSIAGLLPVKRPCVRFICFYASMILGLVFCYAFGTAWFLVVYNHGTANAMGVGAALMLCVVPYILPDLLKTALAALLTVKLDKYIA